MSNINLFSILNTNLIIKLLGILSARDFFRCVCTCKLLYKFANHDELVNKLCHDRLNRIMPNHLKQMLEVMVVPSCDLFSCEQIVPAKLFHTIDLNMAELAEYMLSKRWFLTCIMVNANKVKPSTRKNRKNCKYRKPKPILCGHYQFNEELFIGKLRLKYSGGSFTATKIKGLSIGMNTIKIGIFNDNSYCIGFEIRNNYIGSIKNNEYNKGIYVYASGSIYKGNWEAKSYHGYGKYIWYDGDMYEGEYNCGKKHGRGKYTWENGSIYEGDYDNGKRHGHGKYMSINGDIYDGGLMNDNEYGHGILTKANGMTYDGEWGADVYSKSGTIYHRDGSYWKGQWINNIPTSNNALHVDIRNLINRDCCTKLLANAPGKYCQILYKYEADENDKYVCQPCLNICYDSKAHPDNGELKAYWTMGDYICNCPCKVIDETVG